MLRGLIRILLISGIVLTSIGCRDSAPAGSEKTDKLLNAVPTASFTQTEHSPALASGAAAMERSLETAHKEYLAAYDRYVKMLRESGPQTMETLSALAEYQRKYQTYQLFLSATKNVR
ncbi:MAG TPA: hypothetical protein PKM25_14195 [Candidatus Ozemobacteraceae bacterium]|nr:hypothetical protein [Candidatus Ozemobacteraceae bacterium]